MNTIGIQPNMIEMIEMIDQVMFKDGDRLFYEVGYKINADLASYGVNWARTGQFKEVENPIKFIEKDELLDNAEYLKHHNFMIIKK